MAYYRNGKGGTVIVEAEPEDLCNKCTKQFDGKDYCKIFVRSGLRKENITKCEQYSPSGDVKPTGPSDNSSADEMYDTVIGSVKGIIGGFTAIFYILFFLVLAMIAIPCAVFLLGIGISLF